MTVRFFILQTHYRGTLDFGNEALQGAEKGLRRLWDSFEVLKGMMHGGNEQPGDSELDARVNKLVDEFEEFMCDDLNTAKVLANMFELTPVINSMKGGQIELTSISKRTFDKLQTQFRQYLVDIFGMKDDKPANNDKLDGVMQLLIEIRKDSRQRKDFATSDKIRNALLELGIQVKDEKDGSMSWGMV
jgi:cysteinyl-tRNA synthetase